ncbi:transcriptional regulator [Halobacteria archaeon AArc-m2/3/4]|uniref:Transcriptional regulator n=1 Tax=Natronoglomus mannanivorans TaxID=2979990 RepID=A0AAP3E119_9EURY|nr:transcriptional regulator [Halobacteria archaeon AArc-xg1-1]MCU4973714.1 transcriptional regulator [Halobacteria archaeon AArc-m2/3/4]
MTSPSSDRDVLQTLSRRHDLLSCLENGSRYKRDLVAELSVSRSTIDRGIRELESVEFVERCSGAFRLTAAGRLALSEYRRRLESLGAITDCSEILTDIPPEAPMSVDLLVGASVTQPKPHAPNEPIGAVVDLLEEADRFRGFATAQRLPRLRDRLYELTTAGQLDAEAIFTEELAAFLLENHAQQMRDVLCDGHFDMYSISTLPYGLGIVETPSCSRAFVVVHGDSGAVRGVIQNDTQAALEWADDVFRRYRTRSSRLEPPE